MSSNVVTVPFNRTEQTSVLTKTSSGLIRRIPSSDPFHLHHQSTRFRHEDLTLSGDGLSYEAFFDPKWTEQPDMTILFLHGAFEHANNLQARRFAAGCVTQGWHFIALDHHGHGHSGGRLGQIQSWQLLETHALAFIDHWAEHRQGSNLQRQHYFFLAGMSTGGAVSLRISERVASKYGRLDNGASKPLFLGQILLAPALVTKNFLPHSLQCSFVDGLLSVGACVFPRMTVVKWSLPVEEEHPGYKNANNSLPTRLVDAPPVRLGTMQVFAAERRRLERIFANIANDKDLVELTGDTGWKERLRGELNFAVPLDLPCLVLHGKEDVTVPWEYDVRQNQRKGGEQKKFTARAAYVALGLMDVVETDTNRLEYRQPEHGDGLTKVLVLEEEHVFLEPSVYLELGYNQVIDNGRIHIDTIVNWVKEVKKVKGNIRRLSGAPGGCLRFVNSCCRRRN